MVSVDIKEQSWYLITFLSFFHRNANDNQFLNENGKASVTDGCGCDKPKLLVDIGC